MATDYPVQRASKNEVHNKVTEWVIKQAVGTEFHYGDLANKLAISANSTNSVLRLLVRSDRPSIRPGHQSGWYVTTGQRPATPGGGVIPGIGPSMPSRDDLLVVLGEAQDSQIVLRDEANQIWMARRV